MFFIDVLINVDNFICTQYCIYFGAFCYLNFVLINCPDFHFFEYLCPTCILGNSCSCRWDCCRRRVQSHRSTCPNFLLLINDAYRKKIISICHEAFSMTIKKKIWYKFKLINYNKSIIVFRHIK